MYLGLLSTYDATGNSAHKPFPERDEYTLLPEFSRG